MGNSICISLDGANRVILKNPSFRTDAGRVKGWEINGCCYTGGIDAHQAAGWIVRDSLISGFWCSGGLSEHGIHFWSNSFDTLVERNRIINCDLGIGFGLGGSGHSGGISRKNMLYHDSGHAHSDVGISLESAVNAKVYGNTIVHEHAFPNAIEYRFTTTVNADIRNNLTNRGIVSRDGGSAGFMLTNPSLTFLTTKHSILLHLP